ncbi:MAG: carboxymuconolactone decarboxylase family protein [Actinomycetota bacterium]|nr:carboxymuconolactone decarboxylase family protein [Actinomycetota bacterium]
MSDNHYHQILTDLAEPAKDLRSQIPEVWRGFAEMHRAALADGTVSAAMKEMVAVAIAVARECDGCIASHTRGAVRKGATPEQMAEVLGVTVLMLGGPGTVYGPRAWESFMEFHRAQHPSPAS